MEEPKKKTKKVSTTKENVETTKKTKAKKTTTTEKVAKVEKNDSVKKETKTLKTKNVKEEIKTPKTKNAKEETKAPKPKNAKEEIKTPKTKNVKEETEKTRENIAKKETEKTKGVKVKKDANKAKQDGTKKELDTQKASVTKKGPKENSPKKVDRNSGDKKYVYISVGSIVVIAVILVLIMINAKLAAHAYNVTKEKFTSNNETENIDSKFDEEQEVGTVLNNKNDIVTKLVEKMTLAPNATASIYKAKNFTSSTISNDLKLRLGWAKVQDEKKLRAQEEDDKVILAVEQKTMQESVQSVFGTKMNYRDETFENTDVSEFATSSQNKGIISYENELYTVAVSEVEQEDASIIYQEIQKVVQYNNRIMVYVKTAFIDAIEGKYIIYQNYNNGFKGQILETTREELFINTSFNQYTGEGTVSIKENANNVINSIRDQLNTYIYTFTLDSTTNDYYLSGFKGEANNN